MNKISLILSFVITFSLSLSAQTFNDIDYVVSNDNIANPERGFYHQVNNFSEESLLNYKKSGIRLILKNYILKDFRNKPISGEFLRDIQRDFDVIRKVGFKIIVRFAYTETLTTPYGDAPPQIVLMHINQLEQVLYDNSDVILTLQAGFIGTWGEWYYTDYFSKSPGNISEENWKDRRSVVDALLGVLPEDRMIQLRTPTFIRQSLQEKEFIAISKENSYNGSKKSRLAFHNDCFVAGYDDYGTYQELEIEKSYISKNSKYTIVGGETCNKSAYSNCENSIKELKASHWSFLNLGYHQGVLKQWRDEGCFDEIENKIGYRYQLISSKLQYEGRPKGTIELDISLKNIGWANPTNEYTLQLVLRDTSKNVYKYTIDEDLRNWNLNEPKVIKIKVGLPKSIEKGKYNLYFSIRDTRSTLSFNSSYNIRFANKSVWSKNNGENFLNHTIEVSENNSIPNYVGNDYFAKDGVPTPGFEGPKEMEITQYNDNNIIYWTVNCSASNQITRLLRSTDNINFTTIATKNFNEVSYIDKNLENNKTYFYKTQYIANNKYSEYQTEHIQKHNPINRQYVEIKIDGYSSDWDFIKPIITDFQEEFYTLKIFNDDKDLKFAIKGQDLSIYNLFLQINDSTRFMVSNDSLFKYGNDKYNYINSISVDKSEDFIEGTIVLSNIEFINSPILKVGLIINNKEICFGKQRFFLKYKTIRSPERFKVSPSVVNPYTKVKLSWKLDSNVEGYIIERSINNKDDFEFLKELGRSDSYYLDKNLDSSLVYNYRIFGFSDITKSNYSDTISIKLGSSTSVYNNLNFLDVKVYPNPIKDIGLLELNDSSNKQYQIDLFDSKMIFIKRIHDGYINGKRIFKIDKSNFSRGIYFVVIKNNHSTKTIKLTIL